MAFELLENKNAILIDAEKRESMITLKEASEISGYAPDYIGQLIRQGKLPGRQVYSNVAWVTDELAIQEYVKNNKNSKNNNAIDDIQRWLMSDSGVSWIRTTCYALIACVVVVWLLLFYVFATSLDYQLQQHALEKIEIQQ